MNFQIGSALGVLGSASGDGTSKTTYEKMCPGKYCHFTHFLTILFIIYPQQKKVHQKNTWQNSNI